jgi:hypothetical protein
VTELAVDWLNHRCSEPHGEVETRSVSAGEIAAHFGADVPAGLWFLNLSRVKDQHFYRLEAVQMQPVQA